MPAKHSVLYCLDEHQIYASGIRYEDLVATVDVVVTVLAPFTVGDVNVSPCQKDAYATFGTQHRLQALFRL
jgi:hypothetical protein